MILLDDIVLHIAIQSIPKVFVLKGTARLPPSCASAYLTVLMSLPPFGRDLVVNSEIPVKQRHREFWAKSAARGCDWGSLFRTWESNREPETSGEFAVVSEIPRKTGVQRKTPRGTLSAFSVNLAVGGSSLTDFSSSGRTRTYDPAVNSRLLYQLSYRGIFSLVDLCHSQSSDRERQGVPCETAESSEQRCWLQV